jgi:hypothetical protein
MSAYPIECDFLCPITFKAVIEEVDYFTTPAYPKVRFPKVFYGKRITADILYDILVGLKKHTFPRYTGFRTNNGKEFEAGLDIVRDQVVLYRPSIFPDASESEFICPISKLPLIETPGAFYSVALPDVPLPKFLYRRRMLGSEIVEILRATITKQYPRFSNFVLYPEMSENPEDANLTSVVAILEVHYYGVEIFLDIYPSDRYAEVDRCGNNFSYGMDTTASPWCGVKARDAAQSFARAKG